MKNHSKETKNVSKKDIIKKHMFPLTVAPPSCLEAWIVCLADKVCSTTETVQRRKEAVL